MWAWLPEIKKGRRVPPLWGNARRLRAGSHAALHPKRRLVGVEHQDEDRGEDRDDERDDVEPADRDLREDLVDDFEDCVKNESADPRDVRDRVESSDHDARTERDAGDRRGHARTATEVEDGVAY